MGLNSLMTSLWTAFGLWMSKWEDAKGNEDVNGNVNGMREAGGGKTISVWSTLHEKREHHFKKTNPLQPGHPFMLSRFCLHALKCIVCTMDPTYLHLWKLLCQVSDEQQAVYACNHMITIISILG
jgi:hypothetical protein